MSIGIYKTVMALPIFNELFEEEIEGFLQGCEVVQYDADDFILRKNQDSSNLIIILNGVASVVRGDGNEVKLSRGDLLGEIILLDQSKQPTDVIAKSQVDVLTVNFEYVYSFFQKEPRVFSILMLNLAKMLAVRLKKAGEYIQELKMAT